MTPLSDVTHPDRLSRDERQVLAAYWRHRGEAEMGAELFFDQLIEDLQALAAPRPILDLALRSRGDEAKHGAWGAEWSQYFGSDDRSDPVARREGTMKFPQASVRDNRVLRIAYCCLSETVGCHVLQDIRPRITFEPLRKVNQTHLSDELVHSRVGWGFLSTLNEADRALVERYLPLLMRLVPHTWQNDVEEDDYEHLVPLGYLTPRVLNEGHRRAVEEVMLPGFAHLGFQTLGLRSAALQHLEAA